MKNLLSQAGVFLLLASPSAWAAGDLTLSAEWTAQNPPWQISTTAKGVIDKALLDLWNHEAGPTGPICQKIWSELAATLDGQAAGCLRNVYALGGQNQLCQLRILT